ncbi:hypothetical protein [Aquipuribacter sp. MA13-6]|uniref:hypothetical protein n=1 Tax=unclassified Aquipuribacter TaxID=2635084 RepID=UPI003EF02D13
MTVVIKRRGEQFKMVILQAGPIPPSGGPLREKYLDHHGRKALKVAICQYAEAMELLSTRTTFMPAMDFELVESDDDLRSAVQRDKREHWDRFRVETNKYTLDAMEPHIKKSVKAATDALNYLEDHKLREEAHAAIHRAAFVNRGLFGCPVVLRGDDYWTDCPIIISHLRMGVSAGLVSDFECSVCGELVEDCDHQAGQLYSQIAGRTAEGSCPVCDSMECEHPAGEAFRAEAHAIARRVKAGEVSFVARPRYPLARIVEKTVDMGRLHDNPSVIQSAKRGGLNCDADLGPCKGFNETKDWDLNQKLR